MRNEIIREILHHGETSGTR